MPRRIQMKLDTESNYYTFPINPANFENNDSRDLNVNQTVDGYSTEQIAVFDGRPKIFEWENLPNKAPYSTLVATGRTFLGKKCTLKLMDLSGNESDTTTQNIRVINFETKWTFGPESATSKLKYQIVRLTYVNI